MLLDAGADVLAVDKMSRCGLLPGKYIHVYVRFVAEGEFPDSTVTTH